MTEREILRTARTLAKLQPAPSAADAALAKVPLAFADRADRRFLSWHPALLRGAVAAMVLMAAGLALLVWRQPASAAEQLRETLRASDAFKGWVHVVMKKSTADDPAALVQTVDFNTVDGTMAIVKEQNHLREVRFYSPVDRTMTSYDGQSISITDGGDGAALGTEQDDVPLTWDEVRGKIASVLKDPKTRVKECRDGTMDRFDVTMTVQVPASSESTPLLFSVWIDPQSRLIQKISSVGSYQGARVVGTVSYQYGGPGVADIYTTGVPKDAVVVDRRPAEDEATLVKCIRGAADQDYGDYIAIIIRCEVRNGVLRQNGTLEVLAKRGKSAARREYWVADNVDPHAAAFYRGGKTVIPTPPEWPQPNLSAVLKKLGEFNTVRGQIFDGKTLKNFVLLSLPPDGEQLAFHTEDVDFGERPSPVPEQERIRQACFLPAYLPIGNVWAYTIGGPATTFGVVPTDKEHTGLRGLRVVNVMGSERFEFMIWADPVKGFVPVEMSSRSIKPGMAPVLTSRTEFTDFADLGQGRFYPRSWRETHAQAGETTTTEYHLQILQQAPDEKWLALPTLIP